MTVRGKFNIAGITLLPGKDAGIQVNLNAVCRGDRNATWARATPSGTIQMTVNNPAAADWFLQQLELSRKSGRYPEIFIDMARSTDGYPGDGHAFRLFDTQGYSYGEGTCGECGLSKDAKVPEYEGSVKVREYESHPNG